MVAYFEALSQRLLWGVEENHEQVDQKSRYPARDSSPWRPEYEGTSDNHSAATLQ
jgi:hypothetical protein